MNVLLLKAWLNSEGPALIGSRLHSVQQIDTRSFLLDLSAEDSSSQRLLCSVMEEYPLLALLSSEELRGLDSRDAEDEAPAESNFVKALRFHLLGYKLIGILQEGFDRSVTFSFSKTDMYGRESLKQLRLELVGRSSNAYLLTASQVSRCDGNVLSIFKRVRKEQNRVRHIVTGKQLPPPPPLGKFVAAESDMDGLAAELAQLGSSETAEEGEGASAGANPLELLFTRRVAASDAKLWPAVETLLPVTYDLQTLLGFISNLQRGTLSSELFGLGHEGATANSVALKQWLQARGRRGKAGSTGVPLLQELAHRLDQLNERLALSLRADELELLALEMLSQAEQADQEKRGQALLEAWQEEHPDWAGEIELLQSVQENAQNLLRFSQRLRRGVDKLQRVIDHTTQQLAMLEQARPAGTAAPVRRSVPARDPLQAEQKRLNKYGVKYQRFVSSEGLVILAGMGDTSNDGLLRIYGSGRHLWLHVRDFPGSHVIVLFNGKEVGAASLYEAAVIAAWFSQGRDEDDVEVSYLPIRHLRRPKGGKAGQVLKTSEKVISVRPSDYEALKLELRGQEH
ncbi:DUF814 domain-containing protein [bacterium]|nr:DUF814 domain-containing protein [bacterium]